MTGKSQAKAKCETLKWYPWNLWKKGDSRRLFRSPPLISAPMLTVIGWNKWKQTTKREHIGLVWLLH